MTAPDLKPCPFCGGDKNVICKTDYDGGNAYAVSCRYSECHGAIFTLGYGFFHTEAEAIAAWNTRAVDPAAIRDAALREAAEALSNLADDAVTELAYEHAQVCCEEILGLIGEKE
jgi:Lar family restriction alleviation protein